MLFSEPASGAVLVTGTGECPKVTSVTVSPPAGPIAVGGTDGVTITVLDQNGDGIANATVTLAFSPTGIVSATTPAVTNASGQTTSTLTGTFGGISAVTATVAGISSSSQNVTVTSAGGIPPVLFKRRKRK